VPAALTRRMNQSECVHGPSTHVIIWITSGNTINGYQMCPYSVQRCYL